MSRLNKFVKLVRDIWLIIGVFVLFLVIAVIVVFAWKTTRNHFRSPGVDPRAQADTYAGAIWTTGLFRELGKSYPLKWTPYVYWRREEFHGNYINVGADGNRMTVNSSNAKGLALKVFMFGASTLWGPGARDEYTIPSDLSRELEQRGIHCQITNFGEMAFISTQQLIEMLLQLQKGNVPDVVIFYGGTTDISSAGEQGVAGLPLNEMNRVREFNLTKPERFWPAAMRESLNWQPKNHLWADAQTTVTNRLLSQDVIRVYTNNLRLVLALSHAYGFKCLFYLEPTLFQKKYLSPYETKAFQLQNNESAKSFIDQTHDLFKEEGAAISASFPFFDLSDCFSQTRDGIFIDCYHMGERGNALIAQRMLRDVEPLLRTNILLRQVAVTK